MHEVISETTNAEAKQFDFLQGEWNAICRFPVLDGSWGEGPGSLTASKVLDGCVSLEFFEGPYQGTMIKDLGLRAFNPQTSSHSTSRSSHTTDEVEAVVAIRRTMRWSARSKTLPRY